MQTYQVPKGASAVQCWIALVILDMNWQGNKTAPRELWQVEEIRLCCKGVVGGHPVTMLEIESGWRLARHANVSPAALADRCKKEWA